MNEATPPDTVEEMYGPPPPPLPPPMLRAKGALAIAGVYVLGQFLVGIVIVALVALFLIGFRGVRNPSALTDAIVPYAMPISIFGLVVGALAALLLTRHFLRASTRIDAFADLGWRGASSAATGGAALIGVAVGALYLFVFIPAAQPWTGHRAGPLAEAAAAGGWPRVMWAVLAVVLAPPIEEFMFRGVLLNGLSNSLGLRRAAVIVTLLFAGMHASEALSYWPAWAGIGSMAAATVWVRIRSGSLVPAIAAHAGYNLFLVVAVVLGAR